jgi:hypothetical protein
MALGDRVSDKYQEILDAKTYYEIVVNWLEHLKINDPVFKIYLSGSFGKGALMHPINSIDIVLPLKKVHLPTARVVLDDIVKHMSSLIGAKNIKEVTRHNTYVVVKFEKFDARIFPVVVTSPFETTLLFTVPNRVLNTYEYVSHRETKIFKQRGGEKYLDHLMRKYALLNEHTKEMATRTIQKSPLPITRTDDQQKVIKHRIEEAMQLESLFRFEEASDVWKNIFMSLRTFSHL